MVANFVLELVGISRNALDVQTKCAVGAPFNLRVCGAIQWIVGNVVLLLLSAPSVYAIGALTASLWTSVAMIVATTLAVTIVVQNGSATNVKILFVAAVGRFQNANCASKGVAATVIRQGSGVEMKGMDTVLNVLMNTLTLKWKVSGIFSGDGHLVSSLILRFHIEEIPALEL